MNDERDPLLRKAFAAAERGLDDEAFVAGVMARASTPGWSRWALPLAIGAAAIPVIWLVAGPLNVWLMEFLGLIARPLAAAPNEWVAPILSPFNSLASVLALAFLALRALYRRMLR
jgi:hypothetical protein